MRADGRDHIASRVFGGVRGAADVDNRWISGPLNARRRCFRRTDNIGQA